MRRPKDADKLLERWYIAQGGRDGEIWEPKRPVVSYWSDGIETLVDEYTWPELRDYLDEIRDLWEGREG